MHKREMGNKIRRKESGMALLIVLLALFLVSAIGMGMIYMSTTETSINANYRDTQQAFFAMRAGLEEARDRMRANAPTPLTLPTVTPTNATAGSVVYITNPTGSETIAPQTYGNAYFDDEFCHETFATMTGLSVPLNLATPCGSGGAVPATAVTTVASTAPYTGTSSALKYKWVRITMKQNNTIYNASVNSSASTTGQVCWDAANSREVVVTSLGAYTTCAQAQTAGLLVAPIYIVTSLAITPQQSRRIGQYEVAAINFTPPPAGLAMAGTGAVIPNAPSSNNFFINGNNSGTTGYTGGPACSTTTPASAPAIAAGSSTAASTIVSAIPASRQGNYTGSGGTTPNVIDEGTDAGGTGALGGLWSNPQQLNNMVSALANGADNQLNCGIGGVFPTGITTASPGCSIGTYGTDASPQITYVNGDYNLTSGSGVLIVTGTLNVTGNSSFNGLILVVGQGIFSESGGGNSQYNGSLFIANTNSHTAPFTQLSTLGSSSFSWNGGGTNAIQYNSCWANLMNDLHYQVVSSREEMY